LTRIFALFFIFVMTANLAVSLVKQLQDSDMYELTEIGTDDCDEKSKTEKETEKETFTFSDQHLVHAESLSPSIQKRSLIITADRLISQSFVSLPYLPPEV
jgi:hypothetical protein